MSQVIQRRAHSLAASVLSGEDVAMPAATVAMSADVTQGGASGAACLSGCSEQPGTLPAGEADPGAKVASGDGSGQCRAERKPHLPHTLEAFDDHD